MPLSSYGLCEADTTAPIAPSRAASNATAAVGATPRRITSTPSDERPATNAASSIGVEMRLSPPTTAVDAPSTRGRGAPEIECERGGQLGVGPTPNAIGAEAARPIRPAISAW